MNIIKLNSDMQASGLWSCSNAVSSRRLSSSSGQTALLYSAMSLPYGSCICLCMTFDMQPGLYEKWVTFFPELWVLCRRRAVWRYKSVGGTTPHEPCCRISLCHPPNLSDKPANFPITASTIRYHQASQHLKGLQEERREVQCMLTISCWGSIELFSHMNANAPSLTHTTRSDCD